MPQAYFLWKSGTGYSFPLTGMPTPLSSTRPRAPSCLRPFVPIGLHSLARRRLGGPGILSAFVGACRRLIASAFSASLRFQLSLCLCALVVQTSSRRLSASVGG